MSRAALGSAAVHLALGTGLLLAFAWYTRRAFDPLDREYGEGAILAMSERWRTESPRPHWVRETPYTLTCYGPGYYWSVMALSPRTPWDHTLIPGRIVSLAALVATAGVLALAAYRETGSWLVGETAALLYALSPAAVVWVPYHRVDSLAVLFAVGAYAAAAGGGRGGLAASALLVAAGALVKQTGALAALPVALHLLLGGRRREAAGYVVAVAALGAASWGLAAWASDGYLLWAALHSNLNPMGLNKWLLAWFFAKPLGLAALVLLGYLLVTDPRWLAGSVFVLALAVNAVMAVVLTAKEGSAPNYFLETGALAALVVAAEGLGRLRALDPRLAGAVALWAGGALCLPVVQELTGSRNATDQVRPAKTGVAAWQFAGAGLPVDLSPWVPDAGVVLADGEWVAPLVAQGRVPAVNDPILFRLMLDNGSVRADGLLRALAAGDVPALVLVRKVDGAEWYVWPPEVRDAMRRHYVPVASATRCHLYVHRSRLPDHGP